MAQAAQTAPTTKEEFQKLLKLKDIEIENLKEKLAIMELEVAQAQKMKTQRGKENEEVQALKIQSEGILTKAKSMIFENTKIIKNQELQLEALGQQNESLKDVVHITKDLLEIRNLEVKQLEGKIQCMDEKVKAERTRQDLLHKKLETMIRHNGELKREYEAQLCLFNALRQRYNEKELAQGVVADLRTDVQDARAEEQNEAPNQNDNGESSANGVVESQVNAIVDSSGNGVPESQASAEVAESQASVGVIESQATGVAKSHTSEVAESPATELVKNEDTAVVEERKDEQNSA